MGTAFKLQNGQVLLSTEAPGGVYTPAQLRKIAELCDSDSALAKATEDQRLALFVAPQHVAKVASALRATGLGVRHYQDGLHQPVNCVGELCPEHQQDAMSAGMEIAAELAAIKLESPLKVGINGCARGCVATHTLDISILGDSNGYRISLGGKNSQIPEMAAFMADGVPSAKLPKLIAKIVSIYKEIAEPGESLQEVIERHGAGKFIAALAPYSQDAHQDESMGGGLEGFGNGEEIKLDDLGSPQHLNHDGPAIDVNLAEVDLQAEPSVDGFRREPTLLRDEDELVADHDEVEPETELEPILPIDESSFELATEEVLVTPSSDEDEVIVDTDAGEALAEIEVESDHEFHEEIAAENPLEVESLSEVDAVKLEASNENLDQELDVKMEIAPYAEPAHSEGVSGEFVDNQGLEEELIGEELIGEELIDSEESVELDHAEIEVEPEHLVADETAIEEAHVHSAEQHVVQEESVEVVPEEISEELPEELRQEGDQQSFVQDAVQEPGFVAHEDAPVSQVSEPERANPVVATAVEEELVEEEAHFEEANELQFASADASVQLQEQESNFTPTPDESVVPLDATPLISEPSLPSDLMGNHEESEEFEDLSAEELEAAEAPEYTEDLSLLEDEATAVDEASEDQLERNLEAEIDAEGNIPEMEDTNRDDRHEAMQLIAAEAAVVAEPPVMKALEETNMAPTNFPPRPAAEPASQSSRASGFDFIGLDFNADGRISLQFASGAVMAIDPWTLVGATRRELRLAGKLIVLTPADGGISVEVDGVAIFLPQRAAA